MADKEMWGMWRIYVKGDLPEMWLRHAYTSSPSILARRQVREIQVLHGQVRCAIQSKR